MKSDTNLSPYVPSNTMIKFFKIRNHSQERSGLRSSRINWSQQQSVLADLREEKPKSKTRNGTDFDEYTDPLNVKNLTR